MNKTGALLYVAAAGMAGWTAYKAYAMQDTRRALMLGLAAIFCVIMAVVRARR